MVLEQSVTLSVQFIEGLEEEISGISLRRNKVSGKKSVVIIFERLQAMEKLRSFTKGSDSLWLRDEEGDMQVFPSGMKFFFFNDDDLAKVECSFDVQSDEVLERVLRFFNRYAEANGLQFGEK